MLHRRFVIRQITRSRQQAVLFILCVALSILSLVAVGGFSDSVDRLLKTDTRALHAGDVIIQSRFPISNPVLLAVADFEHQGLATSARTYSFYTIVRSHEESRSLLASLKVVEPGYPFYGHLELASGRAAKAALKPGHLLVEENLLKRMNLSVGDRLRVGSAVLKIEDVILTEPDRPVAIFSFGPRVMVSAADLASLDLLGKGSRVRYKMLLKVPLEANLNRIIAELEAVSRKEQERIDSYRTADSRVKRFFDNLFFFLNLVGLFTLMLAGIGIYSSLTAFLREKQQTIAIMKTLGATSRTITAQYIFVVFILGAAGSIIGIILGYLVQAYLSVLLSSFLPKGLAAGFFWYQALEGMILGFVVVLLFALLPLYRLKDIKPIAIFRKEAIRFKRNLLATVTALAIFIFFALMVFIKMDAPGTSAYFIAGIMGLILIAAMVTMGILWALRKLQPRQLALRQALKGLFRPGNATRPIIITLTAALTFLFSIYLVEQNLDHEFVRSYPPDAPNLFFLDIQPDQKEPFSRLLGLDVQYYPIIRARILSLNGKPIDRTQERRRRGDNLGRTFNLTYRRHLLDDEVLIQGRSLFSNDPKTVSVSIMDTVADVPQPEITVGDLIVFRIQGVPVQATVSSIRQRVRESISPFFYFVFPEAVLKKAPQTIFTAVRVEKQKIPALQNKIVARFPNVTVIDVSASLKRIVGVLKKLTAVVRFFTLFSIVAGVLIVISSVFATRFARIQEAVYYKILGARRAFVLNVFTIENLLLGLISSFQALIMAQAASWVICRFFIDIPYRGFLGAGSLMITVTVILVMAAGLLPAAGILTQKPAGFLKEQTDE